jgi:hypothetical protein
MTSPVLQQFVYPQPLELATTSYLSQFVHVGCGGSPRPIPSHRELGCTNCNRLWPWEHTLGVAVAESGFVSAVVA